MIVIKRRRSPSIIAAAPRARPDSALCLGDKRFARRGFTTRAASRLLTIGFKDLALATVNAWTVETNFPSIRVLERNNFRLIGRQRRCHIMDGKTFDRLLFDLLASEHREAV